MLLFVGTLLVTSVVSYIALKSIIIKHNTNHLIDVIRMVELQLPSENNLDKYVTKLHKATGLRFTFVDQNGEVIAESDTDKKEMENHANRYEIMHANNENFSFIVRYSHTIGTDFLYVAKKTVHRTKKIYVRAAISLHQIMDDFYSLWSKLAIIFFLILLFAFYVSKQMNKRILVDINNITEYLDQIAGKNYKAILKTEYFYEFLQISLLLKNLVKKLQQRDKKNRKYTAKLRLINKQRNEIFSSISHEFKNPIASIIGYAQTLREDPKVDLKIRDKFLNKIISNGEKISKMLDRLALSVKLDNNDIELTPGEFDLKVLCEEIRTNLLSKYKKRNINLYCSSVTLYADRTMIELALVNLMDNALKYSQSDIDVKVVDQHLRITDKGIGIKEEHLDKVTSRFYRVEKNTWDNSMGIGLSMVSYILESHNSKLEIESVYAKGSTFSFDLTPMIEN